MAAPPVAFRAKSAGNQPTGSFPPQVYYRDTYGLQPVYERKFTDSLTTDGSDDSDATKSTNRDIRKEGFDYSRANLLSTNRIVTNTRIAMYSLHMILTPIQALCCAAILYILYETLKSLNEDAVTKGYFFTNPTGHQTVLVPIELKQVRRFENDQELENISIGVQTSGTTRDLV
uniref:Uncharacterized protein n=1 Tax=Panagrolaimus sp. ES5 TaxID=591445 RepID=A0AC34GSI5_9BILA